MKKAKKSKSKRVSFSVTNRTAKFMVMTFLLLLTFSACKMSDEKRIEKAIKEYAKSNFNNPNDLREIESIQFVQSLNVDSICTELLTHTTRNADSIQQQGKKEIDSIKMIADSITRQTTCPSVIGELVKKRKSEFIDRSFEYATFCIFHNDLIFLHKMDSIKKLGKIEPIKQYKVSTRVAKDGQVELITMSYNAFLFGDQVVIESKNSDMQQALKLCKQTQTIERYLMLMHYSTEVANNGVEKIRLLKEWRSSAEELLKTARWYADMCKDWQN